MKRYLVLIILSMCVIQSMNGQQLVWAKQYGRATGEVTPNKLVTDSDGNIFTAGVFRYATDFDPGPGAYTLTDVGNGSFDAFIQKLNPSGDLIWAKQVGGNYIDLASDVAVDELGNSYTIGDFESHSVDFDPGPGVFLLEGPYTDNGFILKLDPSGGFVWAKQITKPATSLSSATISLRSMRMDGYGNLYIVGTFGGSVDFDPGPATNVLAGGGTFVLKLDSAGNFVWVKTFQASMCSDIALTSSGNLYLTGNFSGRVEFNFSSGGDTLSANTGGVFALKMDTAGNYLWSKNFSDQYGVARVIKADGHDNIYISHLNNGSSPLTPANIQKLDPNGNLGWHHQFLYNNPAGYSIEIDSLDILYIGGRFHNTIDVCPGPGIYNVSSNLETQVLLKMDTLGNLFSVDTTQGGVVISGTGEFFRYGYFSGIKDFDPGPGVFQINTNDGCVSIAKYSQCSDYTIVANAVDPTACPGTDGYISITGLDSNLAYTFLYKRNGVDMPPIVLTNSGNGLLFDSLSFGMYDNITASIAGCQSNSIGPLLLTAECDSVWPGDLNYDMVANNNDVLDMLLVYGDTGIVRPNANTTWTAQYCDDWGSTQYNTINTKHADCNGDGLVNDDDTLAVSLNYGLTHLKGTHQQQQIVPGYPDLYFDFEGIDVIAGIPVDIPMKLGSSSLPVVDILGMAAQIKVEGITLLETPEINATESWIGEGSGALLFTKEITNNHIDWAFGRTDRKNVSGEGLIGYIRIVFPADAIGKEVNLYFDDVRIVDNKGNALSGLNVLDATVTVTQMNTAFTIYPNPTNKTINITAKETIDKIIVTDVLGKKVYESSPNSNNTTIDLQTAGMYFVTISSKGNKTTQKLVVSQ